MPTLPSPEVENAGCSCRYSIAKSNQYHLGLDLHDQTSHEWTQGKTTAHKQSFIFLVLGTSLKSLCPTFQCNGNAAIFVAIRARRPCLGYNICLKVTRFFVPLNVVRFVPLLTERARVKSRFRFIVTQLWYSDYFDSWMPLLQDQPSRDPPRDAIRLKRSHYRRPWHHIP